MKKSGLIIACAVLLSVSTFSIHGQGPSADEYVRLAEESNKNLNRDAAVEFYEKAAAEFQKLGNAEKLVNAYNQIGIILTRQDRYEKARSFLDKALAAGSLSLPADDPLIATTYLSLGVVDSAENKFDQALVNHDKALKIRIKKFGENSADVATSYGNIGNVHFRRKDYDKAIEIHSKAMQIREKVFGKDSPQIVESYRGLGNAYREKKDYAKSLDYFERALANKIKQLGDAHKDLVRYYNDIRQVLELTDNKPKADEFKNKAERIEKESN
jgi:tetratricopeptide (TPR) repeat protein